MNKAATLNKPYQTSAAFRSVREAALDQSPISGLTHCYYRYPARFSPAFARAAIAEFSGPGDVVLDPYMGGGTTVLESMVAGRRPVGTDINSLAVFVTRAKTDRLNPREVRAVEDWASFTVPDLRCSIPMPELDRAEPRNMTLPAVRHLRKTIALCIESIEDELPTARARRVARCAVLNVGQWALNGRKRIPTAAEFRKRTQTTTFEMLAGASVLREALLDAPQSPSNPVLRELDAERIHTDSKIVAAGPIDLVVTSPPYPGIHMLYHRWQVDGRKETDAPYWIAAKNDGCGTAYYNFADRRRSSEDRYFEKSERSFGAVRQIMRTGAVMVQLIAFSHPQRQLRRYLSMMERAGFSELRDDGARRTWRPVPGRKWHASTKGDIPSSREVMLLHEAV
ncbi:MAG: hypothetical protein KDA16_00820 [Phycisphaerales bacterium]|nr:hypothetical protein [Phycisphaerales bacterium]